MVWIFTGTIFLSATLLFLMQPMFATMVLPMLGGTPAVWNTCMVFFQAALLAGYLYAHLTTRWIGVKRQAAVHLLVLFLPLFFLPIAIGTGWDPPREQIPIGWLLVLLTAVVGAPFFVVASTAPLLQRWFSATDHPKARDPYFLYAASNAGSMLALLGYPLVVEPLLPLPAQSELWRFGYWLLIVGLALCTVIVWRRYAEGSGGLPPANHAPDGVSDVPSVRSASLLARERPVTALRFGRWVLLAAVPSSLLLGVTTFITTDLVVVPLLWVIPLAIYLLTFMLVFAQRKLVPHALMARALPIAAITLMILLLSGATQPMPLIVAVHLLAFFVLAMVCHGELAGNRPHASSLTTFYLAMGIGGLLGGAFNGVVAPVIFPGVAEYPIAIVLACLLSPGYLSLNRNHDAHEAHDAADHGPRWRWQDGLWAIGLGCATLAIVLLGRFDALETAGPVRIAVLAGIPALACYLLSQRPVRFGLCIAAVMVATIFETTHLGEVLQRDRTFYGVHQVSFQQYTIADGRVLATHNLHHGTTLHGQQWVDPESRRPIRPREPLTYYHPDGPIGHVFLARPEDQRFGTIGLVGLGVGALAAYAEPHQRMEFFEIDPTVRRIAEDSRYFTYMSEARARGAVIETTLGDARLTLREVEASRFDLLVIDAFSSDSIPVHLVTREAIAEYFRVVNDEGLIALHISNRYLDLEPVLAAIAEDLNLVGYLNRDISLTPEEMDRTGRQVSRWVVLTREETDVRWLLRGARGSNWLPLAGVDDRVLWTDDYSNFLRILMW